MVTLLTDNFTGTNGTDLDAHTPDTGSQTWVQRSSAGNEMTIQGNKVTVASGVSGAVYTVDLGTPEARLEATFDIPNTSDYSVGFVGRYVDSNNQFWFRIERDSGGVPYLQILIFTAGTPTQIAATNFTTTPTGTTITCRVSLFGNYLAFECLTTGDMAFAFNSSYMTSTHFGLLNHYASPYVGGSIDSLSIVANQFPITDAFTTATDTGLDAHLPDSQPLGWVKQPIYASGNITVLASVDKISPNGEIDSSVYVVPVVPPSADYTVEVRVKMVTNLAFNLAGVVGRHDAAADTGYRALHYTGDNNWYLQKVVAGSTTTLGTWSETLVAGNERELKLEMIGSAIKVFVDGIERISVTDSAITAPGRPGVVMLDGNGTASATTGYQLEDFEAAALAGAPTSKTIFKRVQPTYLRRRIY